MDTVHVLRKRIDLETLSEVKTAWSSSSNCLKSNWCRIPCAVIIALGLLILFTFFCCCAQCLSCCCCRTRKRPRGFDDVETGGQRLLPHSSSSFAQTDLPAMPSYSMTELKKPTYAVIGDDGSVTTDEPGQRLREDFPSPTKDSAHPFVTRMVDDDNDNHDDDEQPTLPPSGILSSANSIFRPAAHPYQDPEPAYVVPTASAAPLYPPSYRTNSPPRRQPFTPAPNSTFDQTSSTVPDREPMQPRRTPIHQETQYTSSRGQFNEGGPFPIIGNHNNHGPRRNPNQAPRPLPEPGKMNNTTGNHASRPEQQQRRQPPRFDEIDSSYPPQDSFEESAPYPLHSRARQNQATLRPSSPFDPYARDF